jgi:GntR family transcriptional regulator
MFIVLSNSSGTPLYQQIVDQMRAMILSGELKPGDALPSIRQLAADLMTSVITTKRAYQELEQQGIIVTQTGRGTFVGQLRTASVEAIRTEEIRMQLMQVVRHAKRLGLAQHLLRKMFEQALSSEEVEDE